MSHSKQLSLKLYLNDEIRKFQSVPRSFDLLQEMLRSVFGSTDFTVKYRDEEGDLITVACDQELLAAISSSSGPSLKLILFPKSAYSPQSAPDSLPLPNFSTKTSPQPHSKDQLIKKIVLSEVARTMGVPIPPVHPGVQCDGCEQFPLTGIRYKCTVCRNFDYCEMCEAQRMHPHAFLQIKEPREIVVEAVAHCGSLKRSICSLLGPRQKKLKMQFVRHVGGEEVTMQPGGRLEKLWIVRNDGEEQWPPGVALVLAKGEIKGDRQDVSPLAGGCEATVKTTLSAPLFEGHYHSIFRLMSPSGKKFGEKLKVRARVEGLLAQEWEEKLAELRAMGFTDESEMKSLLSICSGDLSVVASRLLSR